MRVIVKLSANDLNTEQSFKRLYTIVSGIYEFSDWDSVYIVDIEVDNGLEIYAEDIVRAACHPYKIEIMECYSLKDFPV